MLRCWPKRHKRGWVRTRTLWGLAKCVPPKKRFGVSIIVLFNFLNFSLKSKAFLLTVARRQRLLSFIVLSFKRKGVVRNCALRNTFLKKKTRDFWRFQATINGTTFSTCWRPTPPIWITCRLRGRPFRTSAGKWASPRSIGTAWPLWGPNWSKHTWTACTCCLGRCERRLSISMTCISWLPLQNPTWSGGL